jgi:hypothetical protein
MVLGSKDLAKSFWGVVVFIERDFNTLNFITLHPYLESNYLFMSN